MASTQKKANFSWAPLLRIGFGATRDRYLPATRNPTAIPPSVNHLTTEWLSGVLCKQVAGARVEGFELRGGSEGTTSRRALHVDYNAAGREAGLPEDLYTKTTPDRKTRALLGLSGCLQNEINFYLRMSSALDIETPEPFFAGMHDGTFRSMIIIRDVAASRGAKFLNPSHHVTRDVAEQMMRLLATVHAKWWNDPRLDREFTWLRTREEFQADAGAKIDWERCAHVGIERAGSAVPPELVTRQAELLPALAKSLSIAARAPRTYLHADVHIGNWYLTDQGRIGITDWQMTNKGSWASDIAYVMASALTVEDRRAWEQDLLRVYLDALKQNGVAETLDFDRAWLAYRQQTFRHFLGWLFTIGYASWQPDMQPDTICLANISRMGHAIVDLDSFGSLD